MDVGHRQWYVSYFDHFAVNSIYCVNWYLEIQGYEREVRRKSVTVILRWNRSRLIYENLLLHQSFWDYFIPSVTSSTWLSGDHYKHLEWWWSGWCDTDFQQAFDKIDHYTKLRKLGNIRVGDLPCNISGATFETHLRRFTITEITLTISFIRFK